MKFEKFNYWKHKRCMDVFLEVLNVRLDNGKEAELVGVWMTQGSLHFWPSSPLDKIFIFSREYDNWEPYFPKGKRYVYGYVETEKIHEA